MNDVLVPSVVQQQTALWRRIALCEVYIRLHMRTHATRGSNGASASD